MVKRPDVKTRKKLRLAMCFFYLLQIVVCTMPFIQYVDADGKLTSASPFFMFTLLFGAISGLDSTTVTMCVLCIVMIVIPIIGFLFCSLDKERNLKNLVSVLCCLAGVFIILSIPKEYISLGAIVAIVLYILLMFLTSVAMVMRLSKDIENDPQK